nr:MAG TPA: Papain fold toxin 1, glutamine deamidase [Caudoviricetes sp.]
MRWGVRKDRNKVGSKRPKGKAEVDKALSKIGKTKLQNANLNGVSDLIMKLPRLKGSVKQIDNLKAVNPEGYTDNCKECSLCYCFRSKGYNVKTGPRTMNSNLSDFIETNFNTTRVKTFTPDSEPSKNLERATKNILKRYDEGDVGVIGVTWDKRFIKNGETDEGHAFNWKIKNGKVQFLDSQLKEPRLDASAYFKIIDTSKEVEFTKIDVEDAKPEVYNKIIFNND